MKSIIIGILALFVTLNICSFSNEKIIPSKKYVLTLEKLTREKDTSYLMASVKFYNNTEDTLHYVVMSCPKNAEFIVKSGDIAWGERRVDCNGTVPKVCSLLPHQFVINDIRLKIKSISKNVLTLRIGFKLSDDPKAYFKQYDSNDHVIESKIIWTDTISIDKMTLRFN